MENKFDAIFIGSGVGALTTASLLSQLDSQKILMIERHGKLGGYTHCFMKQNKFMFDAGIHYVGGLHPGRMFRRWMDKVTFSQVQWQPLPEIFQKFVYPNRSIEVSSDPKKYVLELKKHFPAESAQIEAYFLSVREVSKLAPLMLATQSMPVFLRKLIRGIFSRKFSMALGSTKKQFDNLKLSMELQAVLDSQFGDYGLAAEDSAFYMHALLVSHYLHGAFFPVDGGRSIAKAVKENLEKAGSEFLVGHEVVEILVENNKAIGVRVVEKKTGIEKKFFGKRVISDAGAQNTYLKLLPESCEIPFKDELKNIESGMTCLNMYLGFKEDPRKFGFQGENYWIFNSYDQKKMQTSIAENPNNELQFAFLSFGSLNDPKAQSYTAQVIVPGNYLDFHQWKQTEKKSRPEDYVEFKKTLIPKILQFLDQRFPGFSDNIEFSDLATPLTFEHYSAHPRGQIYGIPFTPKRFEYEWLKVKTPIENLLLTGADVGSCGIAGAMSGGFMAAKEILGMRVLKI